MNHEGTNHEGTKITKKINRGARRDRRTTSSSLHEGTKKINRRARRDRRTTNSSLAKARGRSTAEHAEIAEPRAFRCGDSTRITPIHGVCAPNVPFRVLRDLLPFVSC